MYFAVCTRCTYFTTNHQHFLHTMQTLVRSLFLPKTLMYTFVLTAGWDLVYDNGFIEIDPSQCGYTTFLGAGIPEPEFVDDEAGDNEGSGK